MQLEELQLEAESTAIYRGPDPVGFYMLGLSGEVGSLLTVQKKRLRDKDARSGIDDLYAKELGDILWYVAQIANELNIDLATCVDRILGEARSRWLSPESPRLFLDGEAPPQQQLPRRFRAEFRVVNGRTEMLIDGELVGDPLTDNSHVPDEYRFHDVFHLAHASVLGWSPVFRSLLKRKRKYDSQVDEVEDGARAIFVEEGLTAFVFGQAAAQGFFAETDRVETWILDYVARSTRGLEVSTRTLYEWEQAILEGYRAWRAIVERGGGQVECDLELGTIRVID